MTVWASKIGHCSPKPFSRRRARSRPAGARPEVQTLYERNRPAYERRLRQEADKYRKRPLPDDDDDVVVIE